MIFITSRNNISSYHADVKKIRDQTHQSYRFEITSVALQASNSRAFSVKFFVDFGSRSRITS
ncbi:hypothetical protein HS088_TW02G00472 [Tripterygium wilfordii]|uniref:Uncharacterized protein n=1 Tax=Tripterygium wilfordii TaxID=458696 RepID=A0A7J7DYK8_TRIWF|nr:hypothetical protein HS088_TW02G00472 [Tripterygium wilfordii]